MARPANDGQIERLLAERILLLDGGMGTMLQERGLGEADYRGERFADHPKDLKGDHDLLVLTRPDVIEDVHQAYLEAGADLVETSTFTATRISQAGFGSLNVSLGNTARARLHVPRRDVVSDLRGGD